MGHIEEMNRPTFSEQEQQHTHGHQGGHQGGSYGKFVAMVLTSSVLMYAAMYLNTYALDHVFFSWTRFFMTMLMTGIMAVVMLLFMRGMYQNGARNLAIYLSSAALFFGGLWLVRSQATVGDVAWMEAMIPHHSIAILTSERAHITDPRVRELANGIIETQREEIAEMKVLIKDLKGR